MLTIGLGTASEYSRRRMPYPPQNKTTFITSPFRLLDPRSSVPWSFAHFQRGNRNDELGAPLPDVCQLFHDLVLQIPRQNQHVIRPRFGDLLRSKDRNVRARQELAVLVGITIDDVIDEVGANPAVIQERIAFAGSSVTGNAAAGAFGLDQELEQAAFRLFDLRGELSIAIEARQAGIALVLKQLLH